jgi:flotillin
VPTALILSGIVVVAIAIVFILFKVMWRVAEPNQALLVSGAKHKTEGVDEGMGFRIITGRGTLVMPVIHVVRKLSLDLNEADLSVDCVTQQGIPVHIKGVVIFKVGDDRVSIANAARRFLDQQTNMHNRVDNILAGHLRSIVGSLTVEELIRDRERLTEQTRATSGHEMEKLGLTIDSLQIQEIDDPTGYIRALAAPHTAAVQRDARIAQAAAEREATEAEAEATARKAEAIRNANIQQASYQAEVDQAQAKAKQAGPLADAAARQQVVVQETKVAELEANKREQQLQADVRKPADAKAYETVTLAQAHREAKVHEAEAEAKETELRAAAEAMRLKAAAEAEATATRARGQANAEATRVTGEAEAAAAQARGLAEAEAARARGLAEADAARAKGLAEAESIKARAAALAENQEAVIAQELAQNWPQIVRAGAEAFSGVDHMVVLNGADGVSELLAKALTMGGTGLGLARQLLSSMKAEEVAPAPAGNGILPPDTHVEIK